MQMPAGKLVNCVGDYKAYIPNPLPPAIAWDLPLVNSLSDADRLLGRLAGEGRKLPNPHIFIRPFVAREAVLSSKIEGTQSSLSEVLADQAGVNIQSHTDDLREVSNYIDAMNYGIERLKTLPLSLKILREIHEKLMNNVRGHHSTPGEFRRSQNWIGPGGCTLSTATYIPPSPDYLMSCLSELELFIYSQTLPPLVRIGLIHYQFEAIHPFLDGNGRIGRLLIILYLIQKEMLPSPILYLSEFFEATRQEYYARLLAVTREGDWNGWLQYFLNGIARQSQDALLKTSRINELLETWHKKKDGLTPLTHQLIDQLASNPFITISHTAESTKLSYTTIQRAIEKLEKMGVVQETSGTKRNRVYCAKNILMILEEPANIKVG